MAGMESKKVHFLRVFCVPEDSKFQHLYILQICNFVEQGRKISSGDSTGFLKYLRLCLSKY